MASVGKASLTIVPKFDNLGKTVTSALNGVNGAKAGEKTGEQYASGFGRGTSCLVKSGAVMGVFSAATSRAMDMISSSVSGAVSRLDTLNNYPRVMQALGYSAEASESSIAKMSDHLTGLPTALNDMTSTVQGIAAVTGDLDQATAAGLALNDMLLASGSSTALTSAAMEQFRQMLAKGVPEMQDWKSLTSAMPGQMNQLAQAMLGPTANANDLYKALGGGGGEATISMDQLMAKMVELDTTGTESFTSFADQAKNATGGVATSMANMQTSITRGVADVIESIGTDTIANATSGIGKSFESGLGVVGDSITGAKPVISSLSDTVERVGPPALAAAAGIVAVSTAMNGFAAARAFAASLNPVTAGLTLAGAAAGIVVESFMDAKKKADDLDTATNGLRSTMGNLTSITSDAGESIEGFAGHSSGAKEKSEAFVQSLIEFKSALEDIYAEANTSSAQLDTYAQTIEELGGRSNLSESQVGLLRSAVEGVNKACGESYEVAQTQNGSYELIKNGAVVAKDAVLDLINAQQLQYQYDAATKGWEEGYAKVAEGAAAVASAQSDLDYVVEQSNIRYQENLANGMSDAEARADATSSFAGTIDDLNGKLQAELDKYHQLVSANDLLIDKQALYSTAINDGANSIADLVTGNQLMVSAFDESQQKGTAFVDILNAMGVSSEDLGAKTPEQLGAMASAFDGSVGSITGKLDELGVAYDISNINMQQMSSLTADQWQQMADIAGISLDELVAKAEDAGVKTPVSAQRIADSLRGMGDGMDASVAGIGSNIEDLSEKMADAGISSEDLSGISQDAFASMLSSCGGDISELSSMIALYNSQPVADKDGNVNVEAATLMDAQGKIYTWNGTEFVDKDGTVATNDQELVDSQNNLWTWNGSELEFKGGYATVDDNGVLVATSDVATYNGNPIKFHSSSTYVNADSVNRANEAVDYRRNNPPTDQRATTVIDVFHNIFKTVSDAVTQNASGGIRLHADGGIAIGSTAPRYHAAGAIAHKAVPLDIVGEDGAEAIVPLTNKRYSLPFAKTLAEQMGAMGSTSTVVYNVYLDNVTINDDDTIQAATIGLVDAIIAKKGVM